MDLKKAIHHYAAGDAMDRDAVEHLRAAGLLSPVGYVITEMGRSLMLQNPSPMPGPWVGDVPEPPCDDVKTIKPFGVRAVSGAGAFANAPQSLNELARNACAVVGEGSATPSFAGKLTFSEGVTTTVSAHPEKHGANIPVPQQKGDLKQSAKDVQIGGDHYKKLGHHQPWEVLATWMTPEELRGYMKGTVIAYLAREQDKGGDTDVAKALHTMQLWQDVRKDK